MALRVAGAAQTECVSAPDEANELFGVSESTLGPNELQLSFWRVSPKSEDVLDSGGVQAIQYVGDLARSVAHAGKVRHRLDSDIVLYARNEVHGQQPRASAGAVGHRDEGRFKPRELADRLEQVLYIFRVLR